MFEALAGGPDSLAGNAFSVFWINYFWINELKTSLFLPASPYRHRRACLGDPA